ncbi:scavenger receptor cysteine-rich domain superfamily protein-like [Acanthaster planci]|uniref:Scavenger receptor cysteine-rich domain superfamily protein-like n=1 Tax=Acanthaster planci TaxID=133434 RepID=A0A8B7YDB2_ACAPL|nr:scavenger receptor cysteine-rich domain superfamily protein-like [Acanthaster planci]XP_022091244.1 scavenger receptor cysteine-rich domain superfamily protein-like [Acanthaster planci]XP_022091252.1 scavenger receptor cysteine-rich domain superfamily protein-like [Acanthaster planci]
MMTSFRYRIIDWAVICAALLTASRGIDVSVPTSRRAPVNGDVQLVGGSSPAEGRVEVFYNGAWGTVCDDGWEMSDAQIVCKQLGFASANATRCCAYFGQGTGAIILDDLACTGDETRIGDCPHRGWEQHNCAHTEDAGVICNGKVRLAGSSNPLQGRLEIFHEGQWGTVCDTDWDLKDAKVVCRQLGYPSANASSAAANGVATGQILLDSVSCMGDEQGVEYCDHGEWKNVSANCTHSRDAGVTCTRPIRLVGGHGPMEGRVEIFHNGTWGSICDSSWSFQDAVVVCKQLGGYAAQEATRGAQYGGGLGPIHMSNVKCAGTEGTLEQCPNSGWGVVGECTHSNDAGVICTPAVRLVDGNSYIEGRVEVFNNGQWGSICPESWDAKDAAVACRQLGNYPLSEDDCCQPQGVGQGGAGVVLDGVDCVGNETRLQDCLHKPWGNVECAGGQAAGAKCQATVKLVGGSNAMEGNVMVLHEGRWGSICDDNWDINDAKVVCRQLGNFEAVAATCCAKYGQLAEEIILDDVACQGEEGRIEDCYHATWGAHNCGASESAGVVCRDIRLALDDSSSNLPKGRVEIVHNGVWGRICGTDWDLRDANVLCRQLYNSTAEAIHSFKNGSGPILLSSFQCQGNETNILNCPHQSWGEYSCEDADAAVVCRGGLRLAGGRTPLEGRVEVFHDGQWGTVCDDGWDLLDAKVVCTQLGNYEALSAKCCANFGQGSGPILIDGLACAGDEELVEECRHEGWGSHNCQHYEDAGVVCTDLRLTHQNGSVSTNLLTGRVEVLSYGEWGAVCGKYWDKKDAEVVCQQLFNTSAMDTRKFYVTSPNQKINMGEVQCNGSESLLHQCPSASKTFTAQSCPGGETAGVLCKDIRLVGGNKRSFGAVELLVDSQWGSICADNWGPNEGTVACKQLGYCGVKGTQKGLQPARTQGSMHFSSMNCTGTESRLRDCQYTHGGYTCNGLVFEAVVECKAACEWPGPIRHGSFNHNSSRYEPLTTIEVKCDEGFELIGSKTLQCVTGCVWSRPTPECQRISNCSNGASGKPSVGAQAGPAGGVMLVIGIILGAVVMLLIACVALYLKGRNKNIGRGNPATTSAIWKPNREFDEMKEPVLSFSSMKTDGAGPEEGVGI